MQVGDFMFSEDYGTLKKWKLDNKTRKKQFISLICDGNMLLNIPGKIMKITVVCHIPREISRFCRYFMSYGGHLQGRVRETKFRMSPLPQGGLEIPIFLEIIQAECSQDVFDKMKTFTSDYYLEPEKIPINGDHQQYEDIFEDL